MTRNKISEDHIASTLKIHKQMYMQREKMIYLNDGRRMLQGFNTLENIHKKQDKD
jgi:hypothetical protein